MIEGSNKKSVMVPGFATGSRHQPTDVDTAILQDIGYEMFENPIIQAQRTGDDILIRARDFLGNIQSQKITITTAIENAPATGALALASTSPSAGFEDFVGMTGDLLASALGGQSLPVIDASTLADALNGEIVEAGDPISDPLVDVAQVTPQGVAQVDIGGSFLRRILETGLGGFNMVIHPSSLMPSS
ncbi:MAG: hypothetical protein JRC99_06520 [Deltaproteobacteria bacterium]|nr:hypothetical protein [Deltaproteobacteria bacterium]